jgi:hypothetical protein
MGGTLKPEKCFWYLLDYTCTDGELSYPDSVPRELLIANSDGSKSPIKQEEVTESKKLLGQNPRRCSEYMTHLWEEMPATLNTSRPKQHSESTE